jgi:hypothetical protein
VGGEGRGRPGRPVVIQVGPQCATYTRGSRGQQRLSGPGTLRSKVDPHPNMPHRSTGQARYRLHEAHQARATEREGPPTAHTGPAARVAARSVAPRSEVGWGTPGLHGRSDWTRSRHHGDHRADTAEQQACIGDPGKVCARMTGQGGQTWWLTVGEVYMFALIMSRIPRATSRVSSLCHA